MANEATLFVRYSEPVNFIVSDSNGIEKGTLLKLSDPLTVAAQSAANDIVGGISAKEKVASDGKTKLAVYRNGIFKVTLSGSCTVGDSLVFDASTNMVKTCPIITTLSGVNIVGTALETGTTGETILMELNPQTIKAS